MSEAELQANVARYLCLQYPDVLFHSDFGSGVKLTPWQAKMQRAQSGGRRGWPDLLVAEPVARCIDGSWNYDYHGLFLELKKEGTRLKKKNGGWASEHIAEQANVLKELRGKGYKADFAVGFDQAIQIIDRYLSLRRK